MNKVTSYQRRIGRLPRPRFSCHFQMPLKLKKNYALARHTTYRIGGPAKYYFEADSLDQLCNALEWCKDNKLPWFLLGHGSNILVSDHGFPGLAIKFGEGFKEITFSKKQSIVTADGGCALPKLGMILAKQGWYGFEYMCVIPGTVGAAIRINAGTTDEGEIKDHFHSAQILTKDLFVKSFSATDLNFSYRYSDLIKNGGIVLKAAFKLENREPIEIIKKRIKSIALKRKQKQPKNHRNCGSVFKKPKEGKSAGWYVEQAGLKGMQIGDAQVALEHANWIVNLGNATASDVRKLVCHIQEKVLEKFDVNLERELIFVPEDIISEGGYGR